MSDDKVKLGCNCKGPHAVGCPLNLEIVYNSVEIDGVAEAMDVADDHGTDIGIWIPCTKEVQTILDGQLINVKIFVRE